MKTIAVPRNDGGPARRASTLAVARGEVQFEDVRFHYGTRRGVIERVDLTVQPGEKIGLVGPSGAGKSTLVNLLLRLLRRRDRPRS